MYNLFCPRALVLEFLKLATREPRRVNARAKQTRHDRKERRDLTFFFSYVQISRSKREDWPSYGRLRFGPQE